MDRNEAIKLIDERMCFGRGKWSEHHVPEIDDYWKAGKMAIEALVGKDTNVPSKSALDHIHNVVAENEYKRGYEQGFKDVADTNVGKWIPVTPDTMPEENRVVVVCGEKGTWDYGTYRGRLNSINNWNWKKNTVKTVYWWMYKEDALPMPWKGENNGQTG